MIKNPILGLFSVLLVVFVFTSCSDDALKTPKPRMYPRIMYPAKSSSISYTASDCPFTFNYPGYCTIQKDSFVFEGKPTSNCWFDINSKDLNLSLHCSYYPLDGPKSLSKHIEDAFKIAGNHNSRANYRKEDRIENKNGVKGLIFNIEGPVASPVQFYLTDDKRHFFRASLYYNSKVNPDSTAAVYTFIKPELDSLIATFRWK
jgi:gliding motility-associated lipoprotein GldD